MPDPAQIADELVDHIRGYRRCMVAFSGGVDSALVAKAASLALGQRASAVTAISPSLADSELAQAKATARAIGIEHRLIQTRELSNPAYVRNEADRCYHCKSELYSQIEAIRREFPQAIILNGTNSDDMADYRPGLRAASEHQVRSPLAECGLDKAMVRKLARYFDLPVWDKPATPCLSSRVAYGEQVTPERLRMIDLAEQFLRSHGFSEVRARYHRHDLARLEVTIDELARLVREPLRSELISRFKEIGFRYVTIDLEGFRSGNFNTLVPVEIVEASAGRGKSP